MHIKAILFDLDGTLIDSAPDIAAAINELLEREKLPSQEVRSVRGMIGNGVGKLVERAFNAAGRPLDERGLAIQTERMMEIYGRHLTNLTIALPGAIEMVSRYAKEGLKIAVVSNKPQSFTQKILTHYGFAPHLCAMIGAEAGLAKKPAPDMLLAALTSSDTNATRAIFVGDSAVDVAASRAAGVAVILVRGGYGSHGEIDGLGADAVCDSLLDLPRAMDQLKWPS
jgi:phosphoglycolate phosphatase